MEKYKICPNPQCGKHNKSKAIECMWCETDLSGVKPTDDETEAARAKAEKEREKAQQDMNSTSPINHAGGMTRICESCGTHNAPNARKCSNCGEDISDIIPVQDNTIEPEPNENYVKNFILEAVDGQFSFDITEKGTVVGREQEMKDYLADKSYVSRKHAELRRESERLYIRNLSKMNFTYINNEKITDSEEHELKPGDEIGLGGNSVNGVRQNLAAYFIVKTK